MKMNPATKRIRQLVGLALLSIPIIVLLWEGLAQFQPSVMSLGWDLVHLAAPYTDIVTLYYISGLPYTLAGVIGLIGLVIGIADLKAVGPNKVEEKNE